MPVLVSGGVWWCTRCSVRGLLSHRSRTGGSRVNVVPRHCKGCGGPKRHLTSEISTTQHLATILATSPSIGCIVQSSTPLLPLLHPCLYAHPVRPCQLYLPMRGHCQSPRPRTQVSCSPSRQWRIPSRRMPFSFEFLPVCAHTAYYFKNQLMLIVTFL